MPRLGLRGWLLLAGGVLALSEPALAHPHIFIDAKLDVHFDAAGRADRLTHAWTFDQAFSAWVVQGLDADGDGETSPAELQSLADENLAGLVDFGFYTVAGDTADPVQFTAVGDQQMAYQDGRVTLRYSLQPTAPISLSKPLEIGVYDPEYYVAIGFASPGDVSLSDAPDGCGVTLVPPKDMDPAVAERLYALGPEVLELPPDLAAAMRGTQGVVVVDCDTGGAAAPATALDAAASLAVSKPAAPFGGPPPEPGLSLPRTGFFGWLQEQQRQFYGAITQSLDQLRTDWTAFWVLGGLSFLYGVFHAAGPGHGKVVIASYVLANERQVRRGVWLSVISAMLQSAVAVAFVLVAAGALQLTSLAMSDAAHWIGVVSYGLVAALGLWLIVRKVFGLGHAHGHHGPDMTATAHRHLHGEDDHHHDHGHHDHHRDAHHHTGPHEHDDHVHVVTPAAATGSWREQVGVVLAVGLRPCSGALVILVFALSQGLLAAGIAATFLMGAGTAITVAALAILASSAKGLAQRLAGADNRWSAAILWWLELAGAVVVFAFGILLLLASL